MSENILVSACLMGIHCRYDGNCQNIKSFDEKLDELMRKYNVIPFCPETSGGMETPRKPSEIRDGKVFNNAGEDVTDYFLRGAHGALEAAIKNNCKIAVLKLRSPSCGSGEVYDGTFSKTLIKGNGITAQLLIDNGIKVYGENQLEELLI